MTSRIRIHHSGLRIRGSGSVRNIYEFGTLLSFKGVIFGLFGSGFTDQVEKRINNWQISVNKISKRKKAEVKTLMEDIVGVSSVADPGWLKNPDPDLG
jgi:hypothetical protein